MTQKKEENWKKWSNVSRMNEKDKNQYLLLIFSKKKKQSKNCICKERILFSYLIKFEKKNQFSLFVILFVIALLVIDQELIKNWSRIDRKLVENWLRILPENYRWKLKNSLRWNE